MNKDIMENLDTDNELNEREQRKLYLEDILAQYSHELYENNKEILTKEEYEELFTEYEELIKEPRVLKNGQGFWENVSLWIIFYGLFQIIFCMPWVLYHFIGVETLGLFSKWFAKAAINPSVVIMIAFYLIPLINIMISWLLFVNFVKGKNNKKLFIYIWIIQTAMTIFGGLYLYFDVLRAHI